MSDFESEPTTPGRATASVAFARALTGVDTRCKHMATLLDIGDAETELLPLMVLVERLGKSREEVRWRRPETAEGARQVPENSKSLERAASPGISSC
jgi:hypothetical protein